MHGSRGREDMVGRFPDRGTGFVQGQEPELTTMASQLREDGSFLDKPRNRSSVPTVCFRTMSYLETETCDTDAAAEPGTEVDSLRLGPWVLLLFILGTFSHLLFAPDVFAVPVTVGH